MGSSCTTGNRSSEADETTDKSEKYEGRKSITRHRSSFFRDPQLITSGVLSSKDYELLGKTLRALERALSDIAGFRELDMDSIHLSASDAAATPVPHISSLSNLSLNSAARRSSSFSVDADDTESSSGGRHSLVSPLIVNGCVTALHAAKASLSSIRYFDDDPTGTPIILVQPDEPLTSTLLTLSERAVLMGFGSDVVELEKCVAATVKALEVLLCDLSIFTVSHDIAARNLKVVLNGRFFGEEAAWTAYFDKANTCAARHEYWQNAIVVSLRMLFAFVGGTNELRGDDLSHASSVDCDVELDENNREDVKMRKLLRCQGLSTLFRMLRKAYNPPGGMVSVELVLTEISKLKSLLNFCGVEPKKKTGSAEQPQRHNSAATDLLRGWISELPVYHLTEEVHRTLYYLYAVVQGQQPLYLSPVIRSSAFESLVMLVFGPDAKETPNDGMTYRLFPSFLRLDFGPESGEGHGPRKELFEACAAALTATACPPVEWGEATLRVIEDGSNSCMVLLTWDFVRDITVERGDVVCFTRVGATPSPSASPGVGEPFRRRVVQVSARGVSSIRLHLDGSSQFAPDVHWIVSVVKSAVPCFILDKNKKYCWLNPSVPDSDSTTKSQFVDWKRRYYTVGWLLAQAMANGIPLPCPLPPFLFKMLRFFTDSMELSHNRGKESAGYVPSEADLSLVDTSLMNLADKIRTMEDDAFRHLAEADGVHTAECPNPRELYIRRTIIDEYVLPVTRQIYVDAICHGFADCGLQKCPLWKMSSARHLRGVFCGAADDGMADFKFSQVFVFQLDDEMSLKRSQSQALRKVFFEVIDSRFTAEQRRELLAFVTGRRLLPAAPKTEHIRVEFPLSAMSPRENDAALARLPSSHTCDNTLELPNYLDALLLGSQSPWAITTKARPTAMIGESEKDKAWRSLSDDERTALIEKTTDILQSKLLTAIQGSNTYELDVVRGRRGSVQPVASPLSITSNPSPGRSLRHSTSLSRGEAASDHLTRCTADDESVARAIRQPHSGPPSPDSSTAEAPDQSLSTTPGEKKPCLHVLMTEFDGELEESNCNHTNGRKQQQK